MYSNQRNPMADSFGEMLHQTWMDKRSLSEKGSPSAIGGKKITLSHLGKVFPLTEENLQRWKGWWRYILRDQLVIWVPGCFAGMALPALLSLEFARFSPLYEDTSTLDWAQAVITADGIRNLHHWLKLPPHDAVYEAAQRSVNENRPFTETLQEEPEVASQLTKKET